MVKNKKNLINIDTQFMIGKELLVCPNLSPDPESLVTCHFPAGTWCSLISGTGRRRIERTYDMDTSVKKILVRPVHRFMFGHV